jgi:uncharacterized lipoprotein YddW (UPF0748 family)
MVRSRRWVLCGILGFGLLGLAPQSRAQTNELRALWADAWGTGFQTAAQVTTLTNDLRSGNFNAIFPQVRRRGDAFYNGVYEPKNAGLSPSFDPLADLIAKCHNPNFGPKIEVHAWIVTYHIWQGTTPPSQPTHPLNLHPDWLLQDVNGNTLIGNEYTFDPGHPEVQRHTFNVAMSIITNYNVDGLNFDYIRYSGSNEGYNPVTVARFNQRFGRTGQPDPGDALWKQFRRDQITGLLRKVYLHTLAVKPHVKISCDTITWAPGPTSLASWYSSAAAWNSVLQDWRGWMEEGIMDLNLPMAYFAQSGAHTVSWTNWNNFTKDHQYNRHAAIGPGIYLNSTANAITQMRYSRVPSPAGNSARGLIGYSYRVPSNDGVSRSDFINALVNPSAYDSVSPPIFSQPATIPTMPWKTAPTTGHLKGNLTGNQLTNFLDGAVVNLTGPVNRSQTNDATGFYGFVDLPPGNYTITASFAGYQTGITNVTIAAGVVATRDLNLMLQGPPEIAAQPQSRTNYVGTAASFTVTAAGATPLRYQWRQNHVNLATATNNTYALATITTNDAAAYTVVVTNDFGAVTSSVATLTVIVPTPNTRTIPLWDIPADSRPHITSGSTERGLAFNPVNGHLLVVSRAGGSGVYVLNSTNGADLYSLNLGAGAISGGTFAVNMIGVAADGAVYVGNLTTSGTTTAFRLYRWANDNPGTTPTVAYSGDPVAGSAERWGDTLDVRGAGLDTQVLIGSRSGTNAVVFTTANGSTFTPNPIAVSGGANSMFGLGIAFGTSNTFWGKINSAALRQVSFNIGSGTGAVIQTFASPTVASSIAPIGVSTNLNLLGGIAIETPDNFKLYDLPTGGTPSLIETNAFPTDNANANAVGSVDFGGDRVFALDCQNGIIALQILPPPVAPTILTNPASQIANVGDGVSFHVVASGTAPLAYQWRFNGAPLTGETEAELQLPSVLAGQAGNYTVVITNSIGAVTSIVAALTVNVPPEITADPEDLIALAGQDATFTVSASGTAPLAYLWHFNNAPLAGATAPSYTRSNTTPAHAGNYSVTVSNVAGMVTSAAAQLTVHTAPTISAPPTNQTVKVGSNVTFSVTAAGIPAPTYQWHFNGIAINGATASNYLRPNVQLGEAGGYFVTVSNSVTGLNSSTAILSVLPLAPLWLQAIAPLPDGRMSLVVTGEPGYPVTIDRSTNFSHWQEITNVANPSGTTGVIDNSATNRAAGFYRARQ